MGFADGPADGQPEPESAEPREDVGASLLKRVEDHPQPVGRNADAGVADLDLGRPHRRSRSVHGDSSAARRELDGVAQQIPEDLLQSMWIAILPSSLSRPCPIANPICLA